MMRALAGLACAAVLLGGAGLMRAAESSAAGHAAMVSPAEIDVDSSAG